MKSINYLCAAAALAVSGYASVTQAQTTNVFDVLPYRNPQTLEQWMRLDDARFQSLLDNRFDHVHVVLDRYFPPDLVIVPIPLGFAGPQQACLTYPSSHAPLACRIYMGDLIAIMLTKQKKVQESPRVSPFGSGPAN
ncbi:MAG: hypothetical protein V4632_17095 [Pseudomonadota bacterium]